MCGIAGYNISQEWADKFIDQEKMEALLVEAWLHNLHRGYDAAGFFTVGADDKHHIFKAPGLATDILANKILGRNMIQPAVVFGAHTRQPSVGSGKPEDNENNHPVGWDGVWVTHNGSIHNDYGIKKIFKDMDNVKVPDVDSVAIAMELSMIEGPFEHEVLAESLEGLWGDMAIHAIWEDYPGTSLLARSEGKPLILAYHGNGAMFYGSEVASLYNMIRCLGLDANDKEWKYRDVDDESYLVVKDGKPLSWGSFAAKDQSKNKVEFETHRLLPQKDAEPILVYSTDLTYDWANKHELRSALLMTDDELISKTIYIRGENVFPLKGDSELLAVAAEADRIVQSSDWIYHVFVNDMEIVMSNTRTVKDIFNHSRFDNKDRWRKVEKSAKKKAVHEETQASFAAFLLKKTVAVKDVPTESNEYQYVIDMKIEEAKKKKKEELAGDSGKGVIPVLVTPSFRGLAELASQEGSKLIKADVTITWNNVYDEDFLVLHRVEPGFAFLYDGVCPDHNVKYTDHPNPHECSITLHAATIAMSALDGVDLFNAIDWTNSVLEYKMSEGWCGGPETTNSSGKCWFVFSEDVTVSYGNARWIIKTEETCLICGTTRRLQELPWWFENVDHGARISRRVDYYGVA